MAGMSKVQTLLFKKPALVMKMEIDEMSPVEWGKKLKLKQV